MTPQLLLLLLACSCCSAERGLYQGDGDSGSSIDDLMSVNSLMGTTPFGQVDSDSDSEASDDSPASDTVGPSRSNSVRVKTDRSAGQKNIGELLGNGLKTVLKAKQAKNISREVNGLLGDLLSAGLKDKHAKKLMKVVGGKFGRFLKAVSQDKKARIIPKEITGLLGDLLDVGLKDKHTKIIAKEISSSLRRRASAQAAETASSRKSKDISRKLASLKQTFEHFRKLKNTMRIMFPEISSPFADLLKPASRPKGLMSSFFSQEKTNSSSSSPKQITVRVSGTFNTDSSDAEQKKQVENSLIPGMLFVMAGARSSGGALE